MSFTKTVRILLYLNIYWCLCCCNDEINPCDERFQIITDHSHTDCGEGFVFKKSGSKIHNCFSSCVPYDLNKPCSTENPCPPGYECPSDPEGKDTVCKIIENSCIKHLNSENEWKDAWKPICLPDGTWAPKQCKGDTNNGRCCNKCTCLYVKTKCFRCFCYDSIGNRIFGQAFLHKSTNMTCACSRKKVEIRNAGIRFYTTLHCDSMGNYEPLQCDDGQCWCADSKTGDILSKVVPDTMMAVLPCYSEREIGPNYMRPCESEEFAQKNILNEFNLHGTQEINFPHIMCDDDGNYGYYQITNGQVFCKWKDNTNIISFASAVDENIHNLNCYCARDIKIYESSGISHYLVCLPNGNYRPDQYHSMNQKWYCVDKDGYKSSDFFNVTTDCTPYYI